MYGYGFYIVREFTEDKGYHLHLLLTISAGKHRAFTILEDVNNTINLLPLVNGSIAQKRWKKYTDGEVRYFHRLNEESELYDAVLRYSYFAKEETKVNAKVASKYPKADKTKQGQSKRIRNKELYDE
jgi:hypothetical protein